MSEIRVGKISVDEVVSGTNSIISSNNTGAMTMPMGTTAQRPTNPVKGAMRWNTTLDAFEMWTGSVWYVMLNVGVGTQGNPATSGMQLKALGLSSGTYWIKPSASTTAYQMYVDNDRNGGGWVLCAAVRTATCQAHISNGYVGLSGFLGPRTTDGSTTKMEDAWITALRSASTYAGSTAYWMEATGFNKNMFIATSATVDLVSSASNDNNRTRVSLTFEGSISDRDPNTGTRGFGDHHTSSGTYFAWGRHPESGGNCGFREDTLGASNGFLWVK